MFMFCSPKSCHSDRAIAENKELNPTNQFSLGPRTWAPQR